MLDKETIFASADDERERVEIPEWGGELYVRVMTGTERDCYEAELIEMERKKVPLVQQLKDARAKLVVLTTVDEDGRRIFDDEDVEKVGQKSFKVLDRICSVAQRLNLLTDEAIETIVGNSNTSGDAGSTSG